VMVTEEAMQQKDLLLDEVYDLKSIVDEDISSIKLKVVGVFAAKDLGDGYWFAGLGAYQESFLMHEELYFNDILDEKILPINHAQWYYALDYHKIEIDNL